MKRILAAALFLMAASTAMAQTGPTYLTSGKAGFGVDGVTSPNFLFRYYFNNRLAGEVIAGFGYEQPEGSPGAGQEEVNGVDIRAGVAVLYHLTGGPLTPYVGAGGFFHSSQDAGFYTQKPDPRMSIQAGFIFGADYFFDPQFSLGVKQFAGVDIRMKSDVPAVEGTLAMGTGTWFTARYFF